MPVLSAQIDGMADRLRREVAGTFLHREKIVRLDQRSARMMTEKFEFAEAVRDQHDRFAEAVKVSDISMREAGGGETSRTYSSKQCREIPLQPPSAYL